MQADIDEMGKDLAILLFGLQLSDVHRHYLGRLNLPELVATVAAVAPDARCIAWVRGRYGPGPLEPGSGIGIMDGIRASRRIPYSGGMPTDLAVSSGARHIAVATAPAGNGERKLVLINGETGLLEYEFTDLVRPIPGEIERLKITPGGNRLAIGSRESFIVVDVPSGRKLLTGDGRFPVLTPDGGTVAFVDHRHLVLKDLATGTERYPMKGWSTQGVGSWSPDGRFLLAGAWVSLSLQMRLVAVDTRNSGYIELTKLGEGDFGGSCAWIARQLIPA